MTATKEIFVVTSCGSGHLFPCIELCTNLSSLNYKTTLVLPSNLSSSIPAAFHHHPLRCTAEVAPFSRPNMAQEQVGLDLEAHLSSRESGPNSAQPICAIIDFQIGWTKHIFWKHNIPVVSFFTFGACAAAMEWGAWKSNAKVNDPNEKLTIPGLPDELHLAFSDFTRHPERPLGTPGPPRPGDQPPWVPLIEGSIALMFNTCNDLERQFIDYLADQLSMHVYGLGPLLPLKFWELYASFSDQQIRQPKQQPSTYSDEQVIQWLNTKSRKSVLYVSFGSEVSPTIEEQAQLGLALEEWTGPFIWVIKSGSDCQHLDTKFGDRGLIIRGWAAQLLILSHPSIGGFLSHCGWNSTIEAICSGVPILAWPIRGDQIYNAKLVVDHLKVGHMALGFGSSKTVKDKILNGIVKIMNDEEGIQKSVAFYSSKICSLSPNGLLGAFDALIDFIEKPT